MGSESIKTIFGAFWFKKNWNNFLRTTHWPKYKSKPHTKFLCCTLSGVSPLSVQSNLVFGMTRPGFEPRSPDWSRCSNHWVNTSTGVTLHSVIFYFISIRILSADSKPLWAKSSARRVIKWKNYWCKYQYTYIQILNP